MFTEKKERVTKVKDEIQGKWLLDAFDALNLSVGDAAKEMELDTPRRLHQHISNESHIGSGFFSTLKRVFPALNMNYIISGEHPVLIVHEKDAEHLRSAINQIHFITGKTMTDWDKRVVVVEQLRTALNEFVTLGLSVDNNTIFDKYREIRRLANDIPMVNKLQGEEDLKIYNIAYTHSNEYFDYFRDQFESRQKERYLGVLQQRARQMLALIVT